MLSSQTGKCALICLIAAGLAFLLGFFPMWVQSNRAAEERDVASTALRVSRIQNSLASAAIDARRGEYEPARQSASQFFTSLREEVERGQASAFNQAQRQALMPLFQDRDNIVTLLARNDPAAADRLSDLHVAYRKATSQ